MSLSEFFGDIGHLNFTHAYQRAVDWWNTDAPSWLKTAVSKAESDGGKLLASLAQTAAKDIIAGGLTTASFVNAGKDVLAQLTSQGYSFSMQTVMGFINLAVDELQPASTAPTTASVAPATSG